MIRSDVLLIASFSILISFSIASEVYRPQIHYSHPKGWLSDPNGLVYKDGIYHLYHQCRDFHTAHGPMQWGHAISKDLIHWKTLPTAYTPPEGRAYYSGGAIIDYDNVSGLQSTNGIPPLIAFICCSNKSTLEQDVWMAYSNDDKYYIKLETYEKKKPLFPNWNMTRYFRDPTPFKYGNDFFLIVSIKDVHAFYKSSNLIDWKYVSKFGENEGAHGGSWECASLATYPVNINGRIKEKWVLTMTKTTFSQPIHQYFIGSFDGEKFVNDNSPETVLWLDYGPDSFAGVIWYDLPDKRRIWINWMGRWEYAISLKPNAFNGQTGIPRELKLVYKNGKVLLTSNPIQELKKLRIKTIRNKNTKITKKFEYKIAELLGGTKKHIVDIQMILNLKHFAQNGTADTLDIVFSGPKDKLIFSFVNNKFIMDRSHAGNSSIPNAFYAHENRTSHSFAMPWEGRRAITDDLMELRIIIDANCFEMFIDGGLSAMSGLFYSEEDIASKMTINVHPASNSSYILLEKFYVHELKSIHDEAEIAKIAPDYDERVKKN